MSQDENFESSADKNERRDEDNLRTLTRADLADAVHKKTGFGRTESAKFIEMVLEEIFETIVRREDVKLSSFGAFIVRAKKERQGRNPKTGAGAKITARLVVSFKPSNVLRTRINQGLADGQADGLGDHKGSGRVPKPDGKAGK
jgi:integration host factor subunit alpha